MYSPVHVIYLHGHISATSSKKHTSWIKIFKITVQWLVGTNKESNSINQRQNSQSFPDFKKDSVCK